MKNIKLLSVMLAGFTAGGFAFAKTVPADQLTLIDEKAPGVASTVDHDAQHNHNHSHSHNHNHSHSHNHNHSHSHNHNHSHSHNHNHSHSHNHNHSHSHNHNHSHSHNHRNHRWYYGSDATNTNGDVGALPGPQVELNGK